MHRVSKEKCVEVEHDSRSELKRKTWPSFLPTGNVGINVDVPSAAHAETEADQQFAALFAEELGLVLEVSSQDVESVVAAFEREKVPVTRLGSVTAEKKVTVKVGGSTKIEVRNLALLGSARCQAGSF